MSMEVAAKCECGVSTISLVGGFMCNFKTTEYFPALCSGCSNIVQVNNKDDKPQCPDCNSTDVTLYYDDSLIGTVGDRKIATSFFISLTNGTYKCPQCGKYTLQFQCTGSMFD